MSKFQKASEDIEKIVIEVANELGLAQYGLDFEALSVPKAKEVCTVSKASAVAEYLSKRDDLILVICFEEAFDLTTDEETKYMWIRTAMEKIHVDTEKDKVSLDCPTINVPVGLYKKYKSAVIEAAIKGADIIAEIDQKRKEEAEAKKSLRIKAKKNQQ